MASVFGIDRVVFCFICLLYMFKALEVLINPNTSIVIGGINDDCTVICNETYSCEYTSFYFYNNTIHLQCSAYMACQYAQIYTLNTQSLHITANSEYAFFAGRLFSRSTDGDIFVICGLLAGACDSATFYYWNQGQTIHNCTGNRVCKKTLINAISAISLSCESDTYTACDRTSVILPRVYALHQQTSIIINEGGTHSVRKMKVLSLYPFTNFISTDNTSFDGIHLLFGPHFDEYCIVSDTLCINSFETIRNYDNLTIIDTYIDGYSYQTNYTNDVLILVTLDFATFIPPSIPDANVLYIVCLSCLRANFEFGGIQNVVLLNAAAFMMEMKLYGPKTFFALNVMHWSNYNEYYLSTTKTIAFNSFGANSKLYLGNATDVNINCNFENDLYYECGKNMNIWSTLPQQTITEWDINTPNQQILIHFNFQEYSCTYRNYESNCSFLTQSPTTYTIHPTGYPTRSPTKSTTNPSQNPSEFTMYPTRIPTMYPSTDPTNIPTRNPTTDPTDNPTAHPTMNHPTVHPTRGKERQVPDTMTTISLPYFTTTASSDNGNKFTIYVVVPLVTVLLCCLVMILIVFYTKNKASRQLEKQLSQIELENNEETEHNDDIIRNMNDKGVIVTPGIVDINACVEATEPRIVSSIELTTGTTNSLMPNDGNVTGNPAAEGQCNVEEPQKGNTNDNETAGNISICTPLHRMESGEFIVMGNDETFEDKYTKQHDQENKESELRNVLEEENAKLKMKLQDFSKYKEWKHNDILNWILSLENGRYKRYENTLKVQLKEQEVTGDDLGTLDVTDVKELGITALKDKKTLIHLIQQLIHDNQQFANEATHSIH